MLIVLDRVLTPVTSRMRAGFRAINADWAWRWVARASIFCLFASLGPFFYIQDPGHRHVFYERLFSFTHAPDPTLHFLCAYAFGTVFIFEAWERYSGDRFHMTRRPLLVQAGFYALLLAGIFVTWTRSYEPFIYFQF
jgi:hypothetical protein